MKIKDLVNKFTYRSEWSEEDQVYIAHALELPSIRAHADTPEGAILEVKIPIELALESMHENGEKLPAPIGAQKFKGNLTVRTTPEKHREIVMRAAESNVSLNQYILSKLG
ncbi:MAG: type II toxin-antitoxin system HicB family antitoxin [Bdellovibrionaceae bacterium]|nr:type II toxin-antitoxin system HicB family antitoxin [Pseudobdellovibrionaceae bacterium]